MTLSALTVGAVAMPAHARVNSKCWPVWNADRSSLDVVWESATYAQPYVVSVEPDERGPGCTADTCVQRLWCTDSGAGARDVTLRAVWLRAPATTFATRLAAEGEDAAFSSEFGPGTLAVAGDTVYFYTYELGAERDLPRLSALVFAPHETGRAGDEFVHYRGDAAPSVATPAAAEAVP